MTAHLVAHISTRPHSPAWIDAAVEEGGGVLVPPEEATGLVWTRADDPDDLAEVLAANPRIDWVQLPWAGIEPYLHVLDPGRTWTCAKGVYADPVAEHALAMLLAGFRELPRFARREAWGAQAGRNLLGARVVVLGGGGIARVFVDLIAPFHCHLTVVRRHPEPMPGVDRVLGPADLAEALRGADAVVLALPLVDDTRGILGRDQLHLLAPGAWVVNVARGEHIDTEALVAALDDGPLGGAALDVCDPEPLPEHHPLWGRDNVLITPHTGNTAAMARPLLGRRIAENVARYREGLPLIGLVDVELGY